MTFGLWLALVQWVIVTYAFPLVVIAIALDTSPFGSFAKWSWRVQLAFLTVSKDLGEVVDIGCVALVTFHSASKCIIIVLAIDCAHQLV